MKNHTRGNTRNNHNNLKQRGDGTKFELHQAPLPPTFISIGFGDAVISSKSSSVAPHCLKCSRKEAADAFPKICNGTLPTRLASRRFGSPLGCP